MDSAPSKQRDTMFLALWTHFFDLKAFGASPGEGARACHCGLPLT